MTAKAILKHLRSLGAGISVVEGRIRVEAPTGVLTPELKAALAENKPALLELLLAFTTPVILGSNGEDPLNYRFDPFTGEWVYEPDWWKYPAQKRELCKGRTPCPNCGETRFWVTVCHSEVCEKCHPPRPEDRVIGLITTRKCIAYETAIS